MLGLEHETSRGSITLDYYGRTVGLKIMPTGTATCLLFVLPVSLYCCTACCRGLLVLLYWLYCAAGWLLHIWRTTKRGCTNLIRFCTLQRVFFYMGGLFL